MRKPGHPNRCLRANILTIVFACVAYIGLQPCLIAHPAQATIGNWIATGNFNTPRSGHTATLLFNGRVLVAGGIDAGAVPNVLSSAEIYDAVTSTWRSTGSMITPRTGCTATLLKDGRVLVTGGNADTAPPDFGLTNTAELFDPGSGTWSQTGNLTTARSWHTATLLRNGKVLVTGGAHDLSDNTAELWDPVAGTWTLTGSLTTARYGQTATLLPDGKVLVVGGSDDGDLSSTLASVELYDPGTGTWTNVDTLGTSRISHTATLLPGGRLLVAGGYTSPPTSFNSAELYDPTTRNWIQTGILNGARDSHTATLLESGQVLVAGGYDWNRRVNLASAELYDMANGSWTLTVDLNTARSYHSATLLPSGKVLVAGGFNNTLGTLNSAELYDPGTGAGPNPIDNELFFVRQHYLDFLAREPDPGGLAYWANQIEQCGLDASCVHQRRIGVSAAFFIEQEFEQTGYVVYRLHRAAYGTMLNAPSRANLTFAQFMADRSQLVAGPGLEQSTSNLAETFVSRPEFNQAYPESMSPTIFVNALFDTASLSPFTQERQEAINALSNGTKTRARVLLDLIEIQAFKDREHNPAFVLMQYFGYLRRNPDKGGYDFWLDILNNREPNNFRAMVCGFITSAEYQLRFGSAVTRTNRDCAQ